MALFELRHDLQAAHARAADCANSSRREWARLELSLGCTVAFASARRVLASRVNGNEPVTKNSMSLHDHRSSLLVRALLASWRASRAGIGAISMKHMGR